MEPPLPRAPTRREFLGLAAGLALGAGACRSGESPSPASSTTTALPGTTTTTAPPVGPDPFTLGVASGDPDHRSVVLWTHVDRPPARLEIAVEVARDERFRDVVVEATAVADPGAGMTVRTVADRLEPDTAYWYRFALDGHRTPPARTRTAPAPGVLPAATLRIGHLSCQRYSSGYWTALDDVAGLAPDLVVHCGDYVYESDHVGRVRPVDSQPPTTLDEYRALWRRYKAEPELQAAHAVAPWLMVWDDHEVVNDYQGVHPAGAADPTFLDRRAAAYRAWWEFTPTRTEPPTGPGLRMHRHVDWGGLARFVLLDTRQHRDAQPCDADGNLGARCDATDEVSMLGAEQEAWVAAVAVHGAIWTPVVQQVVLHEWQLLPGNVLWNLDQWDGYTGARDRLLTVLADAPDPVVLTGDVHSSWVAALRHDDEDVGVEFVAPGVSSSVPGDLRGRGSIIELQSPHIEWSETERRGWVLHTVSADEWQAEYRLVEDADRPDTPVEAVRRFTVPAGDRRLS